MARLPKSIIKKYGISKKAWEVFRGGRPAKNTSRRTKTTTKRRRSPRRRSFRRRFRSKTIPIIPTIAGIVPAITAFQKYGPDGVMKRPEAFGKQLIYEYTGYDPFTGQFNSSLLVKNISLWGAAYATHWILNKIGVNRSLKKIPVIGKYISL